MGHRVPGVCTEPGAVPHRALSAKRIYPTEPGRCKITRQSSHGAKILLLPGAVFLGTGTLQPAARDGALPGSERASSGTGNTHDGTAWANALCPMAPPSPSAGRARRSQDVPQIPPLPGSPGTLLLAQPDLQEAPVHGASAGPFPHSPLSAN